MFFGLDVSHHQNPATVPWDWLANVAKFVIVRLTYGTMRDRQCVEHIRRARAAGLTVGAYHFFRPDQPIQDQLDAFRTAGEAAGYGQAEDIRPALDFEDDTTRRPIVPADAPLAEKLAMGLFQAFGVMPLIYITQRDWGRVGRPEWVLAHRLWVAHYAKPSRLEPATPDNRDWSIWQHRVGPLDPAGPNGYYKPALYDQNRARELPLLNGDTLTPHGPVRDNAPEPDDDDETELLRAAAFEARESAMLLDRDILRASAREQMADPADEDTKPA